MGCTSVRGESVLKGAVAGGSGGQRFGSGEGKVVQGFGLCRVRLLSPSIFDVRFLVG